MSNWKSMLLAGAVAIAPAHVYAAPKEAPLAEAVAPADGQEEYNNEAALADAKAKMQKEIDEAIKLVEKIFGVDKLPPVPPAQLALAQQTTTALVPPGSLAKMLDNMYGKLFEGFMGEMGGMSDTMLSIKTGVDSEQIARGTSGSAIVNDDGEVLGIVSHSGGPRGAKRHTGLSPRPHLALPRWLSQTVSTQ